MHAGNTSNELPILADIKSVQVFSGIHELISDSWTNDRIHELMTDFMNKWLNSLIDNWRLLYSWINDWIHKLIGSIR